MSRMKISLSLPTTINPIFSFLAFLRKRESYSGSILTVRLLNTYQLIDLLNLCRDVFEAGLEAAEGNSVGVTNLRETFKFFLWELANSKNHFGDRILFEDVL